MDISVNRGIIKINIRHEISLLDVFKAYKLSKKSINYYLSGKTKVNNDIINDRNKILNVGDVVLIDDRHDVDVVCSKELANVIYEDEIVLIVKKHNNQIIHDDMNDDALINDVATYYSVNGQLNHVRYIHRLDKMTKGLVCFCKRDFFLAYFDDMLAKKDINREYLAIVKGKFKDCVVTKGIAKDRHVNNKYRVSDGGKCAKTYFKCLKYLNGYSLVSCKLDTGRTHQIRVHLSYLGFSIVNDNIYGKPDKVFKEMGLYAYRITYYDVIKKVSQCVCDTDYPELDYFKMF